jgi:hypothetical protein
MRRGRSCRGGWALFICPHQTSPAANGAGGVPASCTGTRFWLPVLGSVESAADCRARRPGRGSWCSIRPCCGQSRDRHLFLGAPALCWWAYTVVDIVKRHRANTARIALTRSWVNERSNRVSAEDMETGIRPAGVVVSICSVSERNVTPRSFSSLTVASRWGSDRPRRPSANRRRRANLAGGRMILRRQADPGREPASGSK